MILAAGQASAAGFFIQEQSVQGVGRAFAGDVALGEDASTIFTNPAGMTRLKGRQAQLGGHYLILRATLTDTGSSATTLGTGGASVPLGVHYRSAISHNPKGTASLTGLTGPLAVANFNTDGSAALDLPAIASAGFASDATDRLTLLGQVNWYEWSRFHEIRVKFSNGLPDSVKQQNYEDSYGVSLGAQYRLNEAWTLRGGAQWDETPTVNGFRTTRTPDGDRLWLSTGASWAISDAVSLDMAYAHIFVDDAPIDLNKPVIWTSRPAPAPAGCG